MRKNAIRKLLHGILDLLPLLVIPTFMIYARNENSSFGSDVTVSQNKVVDFNQGMENGNFLNDVSGLYQTNSTATYISQSDVQVDLRSSYTLRGVGKSLKNDLSGQIYLIQATISNNINQSSTAFSIGTEYNFSNATVAVGSTSTIYYRGVLPTGSNVRLWVGNGTSVSNFSFILHYFNFFNLTKMFGVGNEPSINDFKSFYPNDYYDYTLSEKQLIDNYNTITYNDSDIGSQMVYVLYNTVDKYFNMNNIFGMNNVYSWFELNIFGGTAPLAIYIVWNIVLYEFVMDLLMLLYGLFMWFIDMIKSLMEKPINAIK